MIIFASMSMLDDIIGTLPAFLQELASEISFEHNNEISGEARQTGNIIYISDKFFGLPPGGAVHVLAHELGHYLRQKRALPIWNMYSQQPPRDKLFGNLGIFGVPMHGEEEFAESFATYFTDPGWLQANYPEAYSVIAELVL